jgi:hypothetical protein
MDLRIMSPTEKTKGEFKMITMKVNLLFLAMAADRDHDIPEILKVVDGKFAWILRDDKALPQLMEYAEYFAELETCQVETYECEMHLEARKFVDIVTPFMIEKWEKWDA